MLQGIVRGVFISHPAVRPFFLTIICSAVLVFTTPVISRAAVFVVNTTADTQDLNTADGQCADASGACSLRAAITQSNATAALDVIMVPAGTYTLTLTAANENANAGGDLDITSPVSIEGAGSGITIVQAHATANTATERVFHVTASATPSGFDLVSAPITSHNVDLGGLTIRNGHYSNNTFGAGIRIDTATLGLRIYNSAVTNNRSASCGGGLHVGANGAEVLVFGTTFANNSSGGSVTQTGSAGGGIYIDMPASVQVTNSMISNNTASTSVTNALGGGIFNSRGDLVIEHTSISGNTATSTFSAGRGAGGGIWNETGDLTIRNSVITSNTANVYGGISNLARTLPSTLLITDSTISGNSATGAPTAAPQGGGIYNGTVSSGAATIDLVQSTVSSNSATNGFAGAIYNLGMGGGPVNMNIINGTVANNSAADASGIYTAGTNARTLIDSSTFSGNTALGNGGNVYTDSGAITTLRNSIVANGVSNTGPNLFTFGTGAYVSQGYNRFESTTGSSITPQGTDVVGVDPALGALADNGGPTMTFLPGVNSNVLDVIPNGTNGCGMQINEDQRSLPRPAGEKCDVGAVERQPEMPWVALSPPFLLAGPDSGGNLDNLVYDTDGTLQRAINPFGSSFRGGTTVATGDVNGDGIPDLISGQSTGGSQVKVFSGESGATLHDFTAFQGFSGGVYVAAGDVNNDGLADVIVGAGPGGGPHVKAFSGSGRTVLADFFAYDSGFQGGVRVAAGDVNGDGAADIVTGAGPGGAANVKVFNGATAAVIDSFFAYQNFSGGVFVAAGDINGDGREDIITGAGSGGGPHIKAFDGANTSIPMHDLFAYDVSFKGGVRVGAGDVNGDGSADILSGPGPGMGPNVRIFSGATGVELTSFFAYSTPQMNAVLYTGGIFVATGFVPREPSSGPVKISGRILSPAGGGVRNAVVSLIKANGDLRSVFTNPLGFYSFDGVGPGETYSVAARSKRFRFNPRKVHVAGNISELDLVGVE